MPKKKLTPDQKKSLKALQEIFDILEPFDNDDAIRILKAVAILLGIDLS